VKNNKIDTIVKYKKYKNLRENSKNVYIFIISVNNKNFKPPDLSMFKKKMVDNLKNK
jgi:hypothetical protein